MAAASLKSTTETSVRSRGLGPEEASSCFWWLVADLCSGLDRSVGHRARARPCLAACTAHSNRGGRPMLMTKELMLMITYPKKVPRAHGRQLYK